LAAAILLAVTAMAQAASSDEPQNGSPPDTSPEAWRAAAEQIINGIRAMILAIPQYQAPVMLENGDILIRRKPQETRDAVPDKDAPSDL
jgi:hypothetical protein